MNIKSVDFEDIQRANQSIETTDIKGKEYAEVNQRIKAFRMLYPTGTITTQLVSNDNGVCIFKATIGVKDEDGTIHLLAEGTAYEKEGSTFINKTSYIENCETSAVGRALGFAGFGIDTSIASAEEVQNAQLNQAPKADLKKRVDKKVQKVKEKREDKGKAEDELKKKRLILTDLTKDNAENVNKYVAYMQEHDLHNEDITLDIANELIALLSDGGTK